MKYHIITYGCQMNKSDSEKIAARLEQNGYQPAKNQKSANLLLLNACSVRQMAIDRIYGQIINFPNKKIIIAGCLTDFDKKRLAAFKNVSFWDPDDYFDLAPSHANKFSAYVSIMTGCNNFCSYCVVPFTRGREKSRPAKEILAEIRSLIKKEYKEIILLGQNVNSYKDEEVNFPRLLKKINAISGNFWLNFFTSHPKDMSDELIKALAQCEKITPYIHLPVQSGNDKILKAMNRHYGVAHYKRLIKKIRSAFKKYREPFPPLAVSTDIIVGFPGETKKQFKNTVELVKEIKFDMIYFAKYSPRPGTAAARLKDDVPIKEKKERAQTINNTLKKIAGGLNKKYLEKNLPVLAYEMKKDFVIGKTSTNKDVKLLKVNLKCGDLVNVQITGTAAWGLKGKII